MSAPNASDSTYHARHSGRSLRRAERIAENIDEAGSVLDVGCNNGITSRYLLDQGKAQRATGIELLRDTVDADLCDDNRFSLIEGNIVDIELPQHYDVIVYGAVHHHILNFNGLSTAVRTLQKLADHCNDRIFFETGQIGEGGRWGWQRATRRLFRTDEEHFCYLLKCIEHQVRGFSVIGKFWIHGIRRSYLRIDLKPRAERELAHLPLPVAPISDDAEGPMFRSFGSRGQQLSTSLGEEQSPTAFWITKAADDTRLFVKQHRHQPAAAEVEWTIANAVPGGWAVKPNATTVLPASLAFPYLGQARRLSDLAGAPRSERLAVARQLREIFTKSKSIRPALPPRVMLSAVADTDVSQLCDLNPTNVLIEGGDDSITVRIIDFEQQGTHYRYRNRMHLAAMLNTLGCNRMAAFGHWLLGASGGFVWLLRAQILPFDARTRMRQPSLASLAVAEFRSRSGRLLGAILSAFGLE